MSAITESKFPSTIRDVPLEARQKTDYSEDANDTNPNNTSGKEEYTTLSEKEKIFSISIASLVTFLSPVSSGIYYPSLGPLSKDLNVSKSQMNLTITAYMVNVPLQCHSLRY